jgi:hypothetical protein
MKKQLIIFLSMVISICVSSIAQDPIEKGNILKYNLTPTAFGIYSMQYERVVNPKQTIAISFSVAPNVELPFKSTLLNLYGDNAEARSAIESTVFNNFSITPEYRFYFGPKGAPAGFYLSSFMRYSHMSHSQLYQFTTSDGNIHNPEITTEFNGLGVGVMIGIQWLFGKQQNIVLDWWIVGPYFGYLTGTSHGIDDMSDMDAQDKLNLEKDIENINIPLWTIDATVGDDVVDADLKGGYYGARLMGICIGIKF